MNTKPQLRARKMWANYHAEGYVCLYNIKSHCMNSAAEHVAIPVAVIPLDDVPALQSTAYNAYCAAQDANRDSMECVVAAISAIGFLPRQRKGGAK